MVDAWLLPEALGGVAWVGARALLPDPAMSCNRFSQAPGLEWPCQGLGKERVSLSLRRVFELMGSATWFTATAPSGHSDILVCEFPTRHDPCLWLLAVRMCVAICCCGDWSGL